MIQTSFRSRRGNSYKALIIPQAVGEGNLITVNVDGRDFNLPKSSKFSAFEAGKSISLMLRSARRQRRECKHVPLFVDYGGTAE